MSELQFHCLLRRDKKHTTGWIEQRGAKVGVQVEPDGEDGLWKVIEVHGPGRTQALAQGERAAHTARDVYHDGPIVRAPKRVGPSIDWFQ